MYLKVRVVPGSKKESFVQENDDIFAISVREPAERNMANDRVCELVARHFNISRSKVKIVTGHHSRSKILAVDIS